MRRLMTMSLFALVAACGKVDNPTAAGEKLASWSRSTAVLHDMNAPDLRGKAHPLATATVLGEPTKRTYAVTVTDPEKKIYAFEVVIESAKVTWKDGDKTTELWGTLGTEITLTSNEAFAITGQCDDKIAYVLGAPGEVTNTVVTCTVKAKRPNSMGSADAINMSTMMQIEGSGKLDAAGPGITVEEKK